MWCFKPSIKARILALIRKIMDAVVPKLLTENIPAKINQRVLNPFILLLSVKSA